jgi:hypothetical protein
MGEALPDGICHSSPNLWRIAAIPEAGLRQTMVWPPGTTSRWAVDTSSRRLRACVERRRPAIAMAPDHYERGPDTAIMDQDMRCVLGVGHDQILVPVLRGDHRPWDPHIQGPLSATEGPFWCKFVPHRGSHPEAQNFMASIEPIYECRTLRSLVGVKILGQLTPQERVCREAHEWTRWSIGTRPETCCQCMRYGLCQAPNELELGEPVQAPGPHKSWLLVPFGTRS